MRKGDWFHIHFNDAGTIRDFSYRVHRVDYADRISVETTTGKLITVRSLDELEKGKAHGRKPAAR